MPAITSFAATGNAAIDGILGGAKWATANLTYSFPASASFYGSGYGDGEPANAFQALGTLQQAAVRSALSDYAAVSNLRFTAVTETASQHADLRFAMSDAPGTAWAYYPSTGAEGGDTWFNNTSGNYDRPIQGNYAAATILHEIGHALGLEHAHESGMPSDRDAMAYTVMSYRSYEGASTTGGYTNETWGYAQSLMMYDIAAIQHLYGANFTTRAGDTTYSWSATTGEAFIDGAGQGAPGGNRIFETVWDGGGTDTYDFSNYAGGLTVSLQPGAWTTTSAVQVASLGDARYAPGTVANALQYNGDARSLIENASGGSGADAITGNATGNTLWGQGGDDALKGLAGADVLDGGLGNDALDGGEGQDVAVVWGVSTASVLSQNGDGSWTLSGPDGTDRLSGIEAIRFSDRTVTLSDGTLATPTAPVTPATPTVTTTTVSPVPAAVTLSGNSAANTLVGGAGADKLSAWAGNDRLSGLGGNDVLIGGTGYDVMIGGAGEDRFDFNAARESAVGLGRDIIKDFRHGEDVIDLSGIDADWDTAGNQRFAWANKADLDAAFTGADGQLRLSGGVLMGDADGDRRADFHIKIYGALAAGDVIL